MNNYEKIKLLKENVFFDQDISLDSETQLSEISGWDSMAILSFISVLEENFEQPNLDSRQIRNSKTVDDLLKLMQ